MYFRFIDKPERADVPMHPTIKSEDERRESVGIARSRVLARAGISSATWARWCAGFPPKPATAERFTAALNALIREGQKALEGAAPDPVS